MMLMGSTLCCDILLGVGVGVGVSACLASRTCHTEPGLIYVPTAGRPQQHAQLCSHTSNERMLFMHGMCHWVYLDR